MEQYPYKVAGLYGSSGEAREAYAHLRTAGLEAAQVREIEPNDDYVDRKLEPETNRARDHVLRDIAIGAAVGAVLGAVVSVVVAWLRPGLFGSDPVVGPFMPFVYGMQIGALLGAPLGIRLRELNFFGRVRDQLLHGASAVIVHARSRDERARVKRLLRSTNELRDLST